MSDIKIVNVTLELSVQTRDVSELSIALEGMLQGAVDYTSLNAVGLGFSYDYHYKKSRRGMTISKQEQTP